MKKDRQKGIRGEASSHQSRATDPPKNSVFGRYDWNNRSVAAQSVSWGFLEGDQQKKGTAKCFLLIYFASIRRPFCGLSHQLSLSVSSPLATHLIFRPNFYVRTVKSYEFSRANWKAIPSGRHVTRPTLQSSAVRLFVIRFSSNKFHSIVHSMIYQPSFEINPIGGSVGPQTVEKGDHPTPAPRSSWFCGTKTSTDRFASKK